MNSKYVIAAVVCVAIFGAGYATGQKTFSPQTIEKEVVKTEYRTDESVIQAAVEKWKNDNESWYKEKYTIKVPCPKCPKCPTLAVGATKCPEAPPAEECRAEVVYVEREGGAKDQGQGSKDSSSVATKETEGKQEIKTDYNKSQWLFSLKLGIQPESVTNFQGPFVYGGEVSRRVFGPVYAGVWANGGANWTLGGSLTMEY